MPRLDPARLEEMRHEPTYRATIFIGGDMKTAAEMLRRECYESGLCVTLTPTTFIYTGGEEVGVVVGLVNYPRFPSTQEAIYSKACALGERLILELCQRTALIVCDDKTTWIQLGPPGARQ